MDGPDEHEKSERRPRSKRGRLALVVALSFAVSAAVPSIVSAAVGGDGRNYLGDRDPNSAVGGDGDDTMTGGESDDFLQGLGGGDTIAGDQDDDVLIGDDAGSASADELDGGDGNDQLAGFGGDDVVSGGPGNDLIGTIDFSQAGGPATLEEGNDTLQGGTGDDVILAGPGDDTVAGDDGWDTLSGDDGNDTLDGGPGEDVLDGGSGDDVVRARDGEPDTVECGAGDADVVIADRVDAVAGCEKVRYPDTKAPRTRITSGPENVIRTRKRAAKVTFEFRSSEKKSTFECKVGKQRFQDCDSPFSVKLRRGTHVFKVRATDRAGNTDRTPASQKVTVKLRRR